MVMLFESGLIQSVHHSLDNMFQMPLTVFEKVLRPVIVYLVLVVLLRVFGKRELAQLNPFDLVVLLSLSNTVQNAIIGDDNSVSGGIIGALALLAINWLVARTIYRSPRLTRTLEGSATTLVTDGVMDKKAMEKESLSESDLLSVLHRQGFTHLHEVKRAQLEPNGTFFVEGHEPSSTEYRHGEIITKLEALTRELETIKARLH